MAIVQKSILSCIQLRFVPVLLLISLLCIKAHAQNSESKIKTIVIDAGHGGKDPGTCGRVFYEKDIALGIALRLGAIIEENMPDMKVVYTRKKDIFLEVYERADIANREEADLFISIHANSAKSSNVTGYESWIMGLDKSEKNMEVAIRENAVIKYEEGYENRYEMFDPNSPDSYIIFSLMQNTYLDKSIKLGGFILSELGHSNNNQSPSRGLKQGPFLVLWRTAAPSVLVEVGFLSNIEEELHLSNINNQQKIAKSIYNAIKKYRDYIDGVITPPASNLQVADLDSIKTDTTFTPSLKTDSIIVKKENNNITNKKYNKKKATKKKKK